MSFKIFAVNRAGDDGMDFFLLESVRDDLLTLISNTLYDSAALRVGRSSIMAFLFSGDDIPQEHVYHVIRYLMRLENRERDDDMDWDSDNAIFNFIEVLHFVGQQEGGGALKMN